MCGIFGFAGKNPKKFSKDKMNMLGLANETRGRHSCGVAIDGEIQIGIDNYKLFTDFAIDNRYESPKIVPTVIGHTRAATFGLHTVANAHPFGFGSYKDGFKMVACHNGTLVNHEELAKKYKIKLEVSTSDDNGVLTTRTKIDSEVLLEIIYKTKSVKVLNEYIGAAALVWSDLTNPNVIYCYHGKSLAVKTATVATEERPLFYFQETRNSMYFSSLESPLQMISNGKHENIFEFDCNVVYKITDGNVSKAEKFLVKREDKWQKGIDYGYDYMKGWGQLNYGKRKKNKKSNKHNTNSNVKVIPINNTNIFHETPRFTDKEIGGRPYFNKLAWWRNGHKLTGVFIRINNYGLYNLNIEENKTGSDLVETIDKHKNALLNIHFNREDNVFGKIQKYEAEYIPFNDIKLIHVCYIYNGIMLKTIKDYNMSISQHGTKHQFNWSQISHMANHPITSNTSLNSSITQGIIKDAKLFTGWYSDYLLYRSYKIENGNLISVMDIPTSDKFFYKKKKDSQLLLPMNDVNVGSCAVVDNNIKEDDNSMVLGTIDQIFEKPLMNLMLGKLQLEKYLPNDKAKTAIDIIDTTMDFVKELT